MRIITALFLVLCLGTVAFAGKVTFQSRLQTLIKTQAQATDAQDTVLQLLYDLRQAELDEQEAADAKNSSDEEEGLATVSQYTAIVEQNKIVADGCTANREDVDSQNSDANNRIAWINQRTDDIEDLLQDFAHKRCQSNALFIEELRQHQDALQAIAFLRNEFRISIGVTDLAQVKSLTEKFRQYEHLFEQDAISNLLALTDDAFDVEKNTEPVKTLPERILQLLGNLENTVNANIKNLEAHEIQAAYDYINFRRSSEAELDQLADELTQKELLAERLAIELEVAQEYESRCWATYQASVRALDAANADLENRREFYDDETDRRTEELEVLNEVIQIFTDKIGSLQEYLEDQLPEDGDDDEDDEVSLEDWAEAVDDAVEDGDFEESDDDEWEDYVDEDEEEEEYDDVDEVSAVGQIVGDLEDEAEEEEEGEEEASVSPAWEDVDVGEEDEDEEYEWYEEWVDDDE